MTTHNATKPGARLAGLPVLAGLGLLAMAGCVPAPGYGPGPYPPPYASGPYSPDQVTYIDGQPVVVEDGAQLPVIFDPGYGGWGFYDQGHHWRPMRGDFQPRPGYRGPRPGGGPVFGGPVPGPGGGGPRPGYGGPGGGPRPGYGAPGGSPRPGPAPAPRPAPRPQQKNCPFGKYPC